MVYGGWSSASKGWSIVPLSLIFENSNFSTVFYILIFLLANSQPQLMLVPSPTCTECINRVLTGVYIKAFFFATVAEEGKFPEVADRIKVTNEEEKI